MRKALTEALKYLPAELRKTLTYDRGREMAEHKILEEDLGIDVYFCDPHSPWQKGTCENMNGLIRQYLPKGIDLNQADQHYLNQVAMSLNTRPRKALDWLTPLEKFAQLVDYHKTFQTVAPHVCKNTSSLELDVFMHEQKTNILYLSVKTTLQRKT